MKETVEQVVAVEGRITDRLEMIHTHLIQQAEELRYTIDSHKKGQLLKKAVDSIHGLLWSTARLDLTGLIQDMLLCQEVATKSQCSQPKK